MKKLLSLVIVMGFAIMLGAAGSADFSETSFVSVLLMELLGMFVVLFGISAHMHYKRYVMRKHVRRLPERRVNALKKELC